MNTNTTMGFAQFAKMYCERQENTPEGLYQTLANQANKFHPEGWMLLECQMLDSSFAGSLTILPYGPENTYKAVPDQPISPRGLASDTSVVIGVLSLSDFEAHEDKPQARKCECGVNSRKGANDVCTRCGGECQ